MEVKEEVADEFSKEKFNVIGEMVVATIKQEIVDSEFEKQVISSPELIQQIKIEPLDIPEFGTISTKIDNPDKVTAEEYFVNTSDIVNIKKEIEEEDIKRIKTELLSEECDLPTVKVEDKTTGYSGDEPSSSQFEFILPNFKSDSKKKNIKKRRRKYPCQVCHKIFLSSTPRKRHLDRHFGKRRCVICPYCGYFSKGKYQYLSHHRNYVIKIKSKLSTISRSHFKCKVCSKEFNTKKNLAEHFKIHYSKPYECKICFKQYSVKSTLKRHLAALHSVLKPYKCDICLKEFALPCQYKSHMSNHRFGKQFKCDICFKGFYQKSSLIRHRIVHAGIKFKCKLCFKEYTRKVTLESHMRLHSGEHEFKCHICQVEKRFTSKGALRLHLMNHAGDKPHQCEICSQRFLERQKLLKHLKTHEKAKNVCEFCSVSFLYKIRLQRHILTEHGENPFKCLKCDERFATQRDLNLHASVHVEFKIYNCQICSKQFTKRAAYIRHLGGHGESPFSCGVCFQSFSSERSLREHYAIHPGEKPFHCDVCLKGFHHKRSLHKHICEGKPVITT